MEVERRLVRRLGATDFDELYSQFGHGGPLNEAGVVAAAEAINAKRSLLRKVSVILESSESELLADFVKLLYRRVTSPSESTGLPRIDTGESRSDSRKDYTSNRRNPSSSKC